MATLRRLRIGLGLGSFCAVWAVSTGCAGPRSTAAVTVRPAGEAPQATYAEQESVRPARFAVNETTVLALAGAVPKEDDKPHASFRGSQQVAVVASVAKPVQGRLVMLGGTSVSELNVTSLTLLPADGGGYELRVAAKDDVRTVELVLRGEQEEPFQQLYDDISELFVQQRVDSVKLFDTDSGKTVKEGSVGSTGYVE